MLSASCAAEATMQARTHSLAASPSSRSCQISFGVLTRCGKEKGRDERDILFTCVRFVAVHAPVSKRMHEDVDAFVGAYCSTEQGGKKPTEGSTLS